MSVRIEASRRVAAPPSAVYGIIADYRDGHPRILPPRAFAWLRVEAGGTGAGTRIRFGLRVLGRMEEYEGEVIEPEPGRRLVEEYPARRSRTSFIVDPEDDGRASRVTFVTEAPSRGGLAGRLEQFLARRLLMPIYREELDRLAALAEGRATYDPVPSSPR